MKNFKMCRKCLAYKIRDEFWVYPRNADGLQSYCKACIGESNRIRRAERKALTKAVQALYDADIAIGEPVDNARAAQTVGALLPWSFA